MKAAGSGSLNFRKMEELEIGKTYPIHEFSFKNTKFGPSLVGMIKDPDTEVCFNVFFPDRFLKIVKDDASLMELNSQTLSIIYKGRKNDHNNTIVLDIISE